MTYTVKKKICGKKYCKNWIKLKNSIDTEKEAEEYIQKQIKRRRYFVENKHYKKSLLHIYGIFQDEDPFPIKNIED